MKVAIAPHFLTFDVRFVRKDSKFRKNSLMNSLVFDARSISCERVAIDYTQNRNFTSFFDARSISCERVAIDYSKSQFYIILDARRPFRAKGLRSTTQNRNFTLVFDLRRPCRAKGLRFVAARRHRPCLKRERKKSNRETYSEKEKRVADM